MARKSHDDALGVAGAETIIGTGVNVHGNLASQADIIIDGNMEGSIRTEGNVTVGVNAQLTAGIHATNVTIAGSVVGDIHASGEASILETGRVEGDIVSAGLAIGSGGIFIGRSRMDTPHSAASPNDVDQPPTDIESEQNTDGKRTSRKRGL